jgi:hypothetical protein
VGEGCRVAAAEAIARCSPARPPASLRAPRRRELGEEADAWAPRASYAMRAPWTRGVTTHQCGVASTFEAAASSPTQPTRRISPLLGTTRGARCTKRKAARAARHGGHRVREKGVCRRNGFHVASCTTMKVLYCCFDDDFNLNFI